MYMIFNRKEYTCVLKWLLQEQGEMGPLYLGMKVRFKILNWYGYKPEKIKNCTWFEHLLIYRKNSKYS